MRRLIAGVATIALLLSSSAIASAATRTIKLNSRGELIGVTPFIAEGDQIRVCMDGGTATSLVLEYVLRTTIATPDRDFFLASKRETLKYCDATAKILEDQAGTVPTAGYSLFAYWITGPGETVAPGLKAKLQAALDAVNKKLETPEKDLAAAKAELAFLDAEIKQLVGGGSPEAAKELIALQARVRAETAKLKKAEGEIATIKKDELGSIPQELALASAPPDRAIYRLGAAIIGDHRQTVHYRIVRDGAVSQPLRLEPAGPYPVLTKGHELFAVVNNVRPNELPNRFAVSFTSEIGKPPDPAPVRPSVDPTKLGAGDPPIKVEKELSTAHADVIIAFGRPLKANEIIKTTITTYAPSITSDKTTDTDGKAQKVVVTEMTNVKLVDAAEYPQVRDRYHFNLTTGVVSSNLKDPTFAKVKTATGAAATDARYMVDPDDGNRRAFAVLLFAFYWSPKDIQQPWSATDLIPVPTVGFSLATPKDDFFGGFQSEIRRNVHLVYGFHWGKITMRGRSAVDEDRTSDAVLTRKAFDKNTFVGLSFNINFIKDIFK